MSLLIFCSFLPLCQQHLSSVPLHAEHIASRKGKGKGE